MAPRPVAPGRPAPSPAARLLPACVLLACVVLARPALAGLCDGSQDDTAALNALFARGGSVSLPAGTCRVADTVSLPQGTTLRGAGQGRTIIQAAPDAGYPTLSIDGGGVSVSDLTVDGGAHAKNEHAPGIFVSSGVTHVRIDHTEVTRAGANGIKVSGSDVDVTDNTVHDNWITGIYVVGRLNKQHVPVVRAQDVRIVGNTVTHNVLGLSRTGRPGDGIDIDRMTRNCLVKDNTIVGNDIILFENGAQSDAAGDSWSGGHVVMGNSISGSLANGIGVVGAVDDFQITGNTIRNIRGYGIVVNGPAKDGTITGNVIDGVTRNGILLANWATHRFPALSGAPHAITITGNTLTATGQARGEPIAIRMQGADVRVADNKIH